MIRSMTGIGNCHKSNDDFDIRLKIQSVNSRYLDTNFRLHYIYSAFENDIRRIVNFKLGRGKLDLSFDIRDMRENSVKANLNESIISAYLSAAKEISKNKNVNKKVDVSQIIAFPHAVKLQTEAPDNDESFKKLLLEVTEAAIEDLIKSRELEGEKLTVDISSRLDICKQKIDAIEELTKDVKAEHILKIKDRIQEMLENVELDQQRLEQEVAFLVDRGDITEEIVRFNSHIDSMKELLKSDEVIGKKLDFTVQELNREINTVGSKTKKIEISRNVIEVKSELEKIREQVQNIE